MKHLEKVTRVEVIDHQDIDPVKGARKFVKYNCDKVEIDEQDDGRTLKVFISKATEPSQKVSGDIWEEINVMKTKGTMFEPWVDTIAIDDLRIILDRYGIQTKE